MKARHYDSIMLCELKNVHQNARSAGYRRWFADDELDLIVWYSETGEVVGFQLCYDLRGRERAFTWRRDQGLTHGAVESGEESPLYNRSPMMVADPIAPVEAVISEFKFRSKMLEPDVVEMVTERISNFHLRHPESDHPVD